MTSIDVQTMKITKELSEGVNQRTDNEDNKGVIRRRQSTYRQ